MGEAKGREDDEGQKMKGGGEERDKMEMGVGGRRTYPERDQSTFFLFKYGSSDMFTIFQYTHPGIERDIEHES